DLVQLRTAALLDQPHVADGTPWPDDGRSAGVCNQEPGKCRVDLADGRERVARGLVRSLTTAMSIFTLLLVREYPLRADSMSARQEELARQRMQYDEDAPKSILELQPFRSETRVNLQRRNGVAGSATLINLSPETNSWYLLSLEWPAQYAHSTYHIENPA